MAEVKEENYKNRENEESSGEKLVRDDEERSLSGMWRVCRRENITS